MRSTPKLIPIQAFAKKYKLKQRNVYNMFENKILKGKRERRLIKSERMMNVIMIDESAYLASQKKPVKK